MIRTVKLLYVFLFILTMFLGCKGKQDSPILIKTKNDVFSVEDFKNRLNELKRYGYQDFTEKDMDRILKDIERESIIFQIAKDRGYDKKEDYLSRHKMFEKQTLIGSLMRDLSNENAPLHLSNDEIRAEYDKNKESYEKPIQIKVAHILLKDENIAKNVLTEIKNGGDFAILASSYSFDNSNKNNGGELDWFGKDAAFVPEFKNAAFALVNVGDVSDIIETSFGYHIIKKLDERIGDPISFENVRNEIANTLFMQKFDKWFNEEAKNVSIKTNKKLLSTINLDDEKGDNNEKSKK